MESAAAFAALVERCETSEDATGFVEVSRWRGWSLARGGDLASAVAAYDDAITQRVGRPDRATRLEVARAMLDKAEMLQREGRDIDAIEALDALSLAFGPEHDDPEVAALVARGLNAKGAAALAVGDLDTAIVTCSALVQKPEATANATTSLALLNLGQALMLAERHAEAVDAFEQYIASHGSDTSQSGRERVALALSNLAVLLEEVLGRREEAAVIYRQLLREYPTEALRAVDSAANQASRSLEPAYRARRARALFSRASMLRDLGRVEDARQTLQALAREYAGDRAPLVSAIRDSSRRLQAALD